MSDRADSAAGAGMEQALRAERVQVWKQNAERWLDGQHQGRLFTADDLVADIGLPDVGQGRNNVVGAWINAQQKRQRIEFTGRLDKSRRVEGHGNLQRLWRVKDERNELEETPPSPFDGGVSSSPRGSAYPTQRVEAATTLEARGGWDEPRHPEADAATAPTANQRGADASAESVRAETRREEDGTEVDPGSDLNADQEPGWLLRSLQAEEAA